MADAAKKIDDSVGEEQAQGVPDEIKPIGVNRFALADQIRNHYHINCKVGTKPDDVLQATFWEHVAQYIARGDIVTITPDNLTWECSVVVLDKGHNWALVRERYRYDLGDEFDPSAKQGSDYDVEWGGTTDKYRVKYKGKVLKSGLATASLANRWASNHAAALQR